jgi:hypothetical protein
MREGLWLLAFLVIYIALTQWVFPKLGVPT